MEDAERTSLAKALSDLEWERVVEAVAARCRGPLREKLEHLEPAATYEEARAALAEAAEALALDAAGEPIPLDGIRDVRASLDRLERHGALDGPALRAIASTLGAARVLRKYLARRRDRAPALYRACSTDPTLDELADELERNVEPDGTLSDHASPELARLRTEIANLRARIVSRLDAMLLEHADIVQDRWHTLREGRYVLPIRTDAHEKIPGIVHGTSGSGATVFVEPRAIVAQGNRLKMAEGELEREVARILAILSARVGERLAAVRAAVDALDRADLRSAAAKLARDLGGTVPELGREPVIDLKAARHPLLLLEGVDVVPNDLSLSAGGCLVLSGPNAGGKTVSLKVLGLAALMARSGLPLPAAEGSRVGFFAPILTDVGDEQSIEKNLSTFSAHVTNLARILDRAGPSAMVLLDELATGTDPEEGAALACAVVDA
ncbi:MAG TPA: endonuclease MutS2, partial [Sandaracinaceae bacterium]